MKAFNLLILCWLGLGIGPFHGSAAGLFTPTSSFTDIPDGVFINVSGYEMLQPMHSGQLTITPVPTLLAASGTFSQYVPPNTPSEPGDGYGMLASDRAPNPVGDLTLNFSTPVAAFGVTFFHLDATTLRRWGLHLPGLIRAYDGPNASGNFLGSVQSIGWIPSALGYNFDFVAVMSDSPNIQSVVIGGSTDPKGYGVDGYAYSLTPIPEPGVGSVLGVGLLGLVGVRQFRSRAG